MEMITAKIMIIICQERERRREHILLIKQLDNKKRNEDRKKKIEELKVNTEQYNLLKTLKIDTRVPEMPRNSKLTVQKLYDNFLSKNSNLMTDADVVGGKRAKYWFN